MDYKGKRLLDFNGGGDCYANSWYFNFFETKIYKICLKNPVVKPLTDLGVGVGVHQFETKMAKN